MSESEARAADLPLWILRGRGRMLWIAAAETPRDACWIKYWQRFNCGAPDSYLDRTAPKLERLEDFTGLPLDYRVAVDDDEVDFPGSEPLSLWLDVAVERASVARTPGTPEYRAAVEAAGQVSLLDPIQETER